jgi:hypothetical protein
MNISYTLNKNIEVDKLVKDVTKLIASVPQNDVNNHVLVISVHKICDYESDSLIPKISFDPSCTT